jgi:hypothetical protein
MLANKFHLNFVVQPWIHFEQLAIDFALLFREGFAGRFS